MTRQARTASVVSAASALSGHRRRLLMARVFVAMSGGVDSSVAAALLLEQGHDVTGVTMQLWPSSTTRAAAVRSSAVRDARRVCDLLGIPHYALNYREMFEREVVDPFAEAYAAGGHRTRASRATTGSSSRTCSRRSRPGRRVPGHRALRAHRPRCGGRAVARRGGGPGQGPELLPLPLDADADGHVLFPSVSCARPRSAHGASGSACRRRQAGEPGDMLRRRGRLRCRRGERVPEAVAPGDIVDRTAASSGGTRGSLTTRSASARASASAAREALSWCASSRARTAWSSVLATRLR